MPSQWGLSPDDILAIQGVLKNHLLILKAILYGSRAKGTFKPGSDIDLTLIAPQMSLDELLLIENELDDLDLPYKMDLSLFHQIENDHLIEHINRVGAVFYTTE